MWKSRNFEQWQKTHELLWPGVTLPEVFVPIASNNAAEGDEAKGKGRRVFMEGTLHSSYVFACLFSQCSAKRQAAVQRCKYMSMFYELLMTACRGGKLQLPIENSQGRQVVSVSASGNITTDVLFGSLPRDEFDVLKEAWLMDVQDGVI